MGLIPGSRLLRRFVVSGLVLGALFTVVNVGVERVAEGRIAAFAQRELKTDSLPTLDVGGFPLVVNVLRGRLPRASLNVENLTLDKMRIRRIHVEMRDLYVPGGLVGGRPYTVVVGQGSVAIAIEDDAINAMLKESGEDARVRIRSSSVALRARMRIGGRMRSLVATGGFVVRSGFLVFAPRKVTLDGNPPPKYYEERVRREATVRVALPDLPEGIKLQAPDLAAGSMTLSADLRNARLKLG
ncbi:MAG: DUF2993 domain-containing protein [Actinomycetota bacterium]